MTEDLATLGENFYYSQRYYGATHDFAASQAIMYVRRKAPWLHQWDISEAILARIPDPALALQGL